MRAEWQPFVLAGDLSPAPATYPGVLTERAAPAPLFGLAPHGVCPASRITAAAVRSYRTFSPLPDFVIFMTRPGGIVFCGTFRETRFERVPPAVSRHAALWRPDFPPAHTSCLAPAGGCPSGRLGFIIEGRRPVGQERCRLSISELAERFSMAQHMVPPENLSFHASRFVYAGIIRTIPVLEVPATERCQFDRRVTE